MWEDKLLKGNNGGLEAYFWNEENDDTSNALISNLCYQSLSDECKRLILDIVWNECVDEESLNLLIGKTKEELESIKKDKNFILDVTWKENICITDLMDLREIMSKDYKKFIFDLDHTLLIPDWSREDDYFRENIDLKEQEEFFKVKQHILDEYEWMFPKCEYNTLSDCFKEYGLHVSEDTLAEWMRYNWETIEDEVVDGAVDLLKYLKWKGKEIVILTNWFAATQKPRLERSGLISYIDKIVAGDDAMKPNLQSFNLAIWDVDRNDCIMIGDKLEIDGLGAKNAGIDYFILGNFSIRNLFDIIRKSWEMKKVK